MIEVAEVQQQRVLGRWRACTQPIDSALKQSRRDLAIVIRAGFVSVRIHAVVVVTDWIDRHQVGIHKRRFRHERCQALEILGQRLDHLFDGFEPRRFVDA